MINIVVYFLYGFFFLHFFYRLFSCLARELLLSCTWNFWIPKAECCRLRWNWIDYYYYYYYYEQSLIVCIVQLNAMKNNHSKSILSTDSYQFMHMSSTISVKCSVFSVQLISLYHLIHFKCNRMLESIFVLAYLCQLKINYANWNVMSNELRTTLG